MYNSKHQSFCGWWAPRYININRYNSITPPNNRIRIMIVTPPFAQLPIEITHFGSIVCSYNRRKAGAILFVKVPATIIKSDCLGVALKITPNLSKSYLLTVECIISTAQQAKPNVKGQNEPCLAHETNDFAGVTT